jgi:hypothetical protein
MAWTHKAKHSPSPLFHRLLSYLSPDWIPILLDLFRTLRQFLRHERHEGLYDILTYDATLELMDPKGETAVFSRHQKVKFLQDNVIAFQDYAWGDGEIFAEYQCSPGVVVDRYQEGDQWNMLISLRETKSAGDIQDFHTTRTIKVGFTQAEEWWQTEIRHRTRWFRLDIMFPKERHPRRAVLAQRSRNRTEVLGRDCFAELPRGRQILTWETKRPHRFETYTIKMDVVGSTNSRKSDDQLLSSCPVEQTLEGLQAAVDGGRGQFPAHQVAPVILNIARIDGLGVEGSPTGLLEPTGKASHVLHVGADRVGAFPSAG